MTDKGGVGPEPAESEKLCETAEYEEVQNEPVTSASSATTHISASIAPSPAAVTASPDANSTFLGARRSLSETSQPFLKCQASFSESASTEPANVREETGSSPKATVSSPKATGSPPKATDSSPKAKVLLPKPIGSLPKATCSMPMPTGTLPMSTGTTPKAGSSPISTSTTPKFDSSPMSTGTTPKAGSSPMSAGTTPKAGSSPMSTGTTPKAGSSPMSTGTTPKAGTSPMSTGTTPKAGTSPMSTGRTPKAGSSPISTDTTPKAGSSPMSTDTSPKAPGTFPPSISTAGSTGAIPRTQVAATKEFQSRMALIQAAKEKATKCRKIRNETRSRSRSGSSSDSTTREDVTPSTSFRITPKDSETIKRTGNLLIVSMAQCESVKRLPVPKRKRGPMKIIVLDIALEIEQYVTVLYKEHPPNEDSSIRYFLLPAPDERVLASVRRNIVVNEIYIKREDILNNTLAVTLWDKEGVRNITLTIYVESFVGATIPQPVFPEVGRKCLARICSQKRDKESCSIQLYPAYVDIITYVMTYYMNETLLENPRLPSVTNPRPGQVYIYHNKSTMSAFRVRLIDPEFDDDELPDQLVPTCGTQARGPEDSGVALEETGISPENLPIPSEVSEVTCKGETEESEDKNEKNISEKSIKPEQQIFKVKFIDYAVEADVRAGNMFEFYSIHLVPLESKPPQGLEANVFKVGTTHDELKSWVKCVMMRLIHIEVVDHGAVGFLPSVEVFDYVAEEHHVVSP